MKNDVLYVLKELMKVQSWSLEKEIVDATEGSYKEGYFHGKDEAYQYVYTVLENLLEGLYE